MEVKSFILLAMFITQTCVAGNIVFVEDKFNFSYKNLASVPRTIPAIATQLILSHNLLTGIKYGDFNRMINLTYLDISYNRINKFDKMSFKGLTQLQVLNISSNNLSDGSSLPEGLFKPLSLSLLELDLRHNLIYRRYPDNVIKDLISLRILKLDCVNGQFVILSIN